MLTEIAGLWEIGAAECLVALAAGGVFGLAVFWSFLLEAWASFGEERASFARAVSLEEKDKSSARSPLAGQSPSAGEGGFSLIEVMVADLAARAEANGGDFDNIEPPCQDASGPGCRGEGDGASTQPQYFTGISGLIWESYVNQPWGRLQISNTNHSSIITSTNGTAF